MTDVQMNEEVREEILEKETSLLDRLFQAAEYNEDPAMICNISIDRAGEHLFSFRIHPLTFEDIKNAQKRGTKYEAVTQNGRKVREPVEVDENVVNCMAIYLATVDEDREKIWNNKQVMARYNLIENLDVVDKLLMPGEKVRIVEAINQLSGFNADVIDDVKNS